MSSHSAMIMFITMLILTTGGIAVFYEVSTNYREQTHAMQKQTDSQQKEGLTLVNTVGTQVVNDTFKYVQLQVRYTGKEKLNLNDTFVQLRTDKSVADLQYRNGTAYHDTVNGFYTQ